MNHLVRKYLHCFILFWVSCLFSQTMLAQAPCHGCPPAVGGSHSSDYCMCECGDIEICNYPPICPETVSPLDNTLIGILMGHEQAICQLSHLDSLGWDLCNLPCIDTLRWQIDSLSIIFNNLSDTCYQCYSRLDLGRTGNVTSLVFGSEDGGGTSWNVGSVPLSVMGMPVLSDATLDAVSFLEQEVDSVRWGLVGGQYYLEMWGSAVWFDGAFVNGVNVRNVVVDCDTVLCFSGGGGVGSLSCSELELLDCWQDLEGQVDSLYFLLTDSIYVEIDSIWGYLDTLDAGDVLIDNSVDLSCFDVCFADPDSVTVADVLSEILNYICEDTVCFCADTLGLDIYYDGSLAVALVSGDLSGVSFSWDVTGDLSMTTDSTAMFVGVDVPISGNGLLIVTAYKQDCEPVTDTLFIDGCDYFEADVWLEEVDFDLELSYNALGCSVMGNEHTYYFSASIPGGVWEINVSNFVGQFDTLSVGGDLVVNTQLLGSHYFVIRYSVNGRQVWYSFSGDPFGDCDDVLFVLGGRNCVSIVEAFTSAGVITGYAWDALSDSIVWSGGNEAVVMPLLSVPGDTLGVTLLATINGCFEVQSDTIDVLPCTGDCPDSVFVSFQNYDNELGGYAVHANVLPLGLFYDCTVDTLEYIDAASVGYFGILPAYYSVADDYFCDSLASQGYCGWFGMNIDTLHFANAAEIIVQPQSEDNMLCFGVNMSGGCGYVCDCVVLPYQVLECQIDSIGWQFLEYDVCEGFASIGVVGDTISGLTFNVEGISQSCSFPSPIVLSSLTINNVVNETYSCISSLGMTWVENVYVDTSVIYTLHIDGLYGGELTNVIGNNIGSVKFNCTKTNCDPSGYSTIVLHSVYGQATSGVYLVGRGNYGLSYFEAGDTLYFNNIGDSSSVSILAQDWQNPFCRIDTSIVLPDCIMCDVGTSQLAIDYNTSGNAVDFELIDVNCLVSGSREFVVRSMQAGVYEISETLGSEFSVGGSGTPSVNSGVVGANISYSFTDDIAEELVLVIRFTNSNGDYVIKQFSYLPAFSVCPSFSVSDVSVSTIRGVLGNLTASAWLNGSGSFLNAQQPVWSIISGSGNLSFESSNIGSEVSLLGCTGNLVAFVATDCDTLYSDTLAIDLCGVGSCDTAQISLSYTLLPGTANTYYVIPSVSLYNNLVTSYPSPEWWGVDTSELNVVSIGTTHIIVEIDTITEVCFGIPPSELISTECGSLSACVELPYNSCGTSGGGGMVISPVNLYSGITPGSGCDCSTTGEFYITGGTPPYSIDLIFQGLGFGYVELYPLTAPFYGAHYCGTPLSVSGSGTVSDPFVIANMGAFNGNYTINISDANGCDEQLIYGEYISCSNVIDLDVNCNIGTIDNEFCFEATPNNDNIEGSACIETDSIFYSLDGGVTWVYGDSVCVVVAPDTVQINNFFFMKDKRLPHPNNDWEFSLKYCGTASAVDSIRFEWGDGTTQTFINPSLSCSSWTVYPHTFPTNGMYESTFYIFDNQGLEGRGQWVTFGDGSVYAYVIGSPIVGGVTASLDLPTDVYHIYQRFQDNGGNFPDSTGVVFANIQGVFYPMIDAGSVDTIVSDSIIHTYIVPTSGKVIATGSMGNYDVYHIWEFDISLNLDVTLWWKRKTTFEACDTEVSVWQTDLEPYIGVNACPPIQRPHNPLAMRQDNSETGGKTMASKEVSRVPSVAAYSNDSRDDYAVFGFIGGVFHSLALLSFAVLCLVAAGWILENLRHNYHDNKRGG